MLELLLFLGASIFGGALLWVLDPIVCFFDNTKIDLDDPAHWRITDKYTERGVQPARDSVDISLIFPAYNEEARLPITLSKADEFLRKWSAERRLSYEVIVVDDGSKDATTEVAKKWYAAHPEHYRVVTLVKNQGKGGAVKVGVAQALGRAMLMVDADGATEIEDLDGLYNQLQVLRGAAGDGQGLVIGSRAHMADKSMASRQFYRTVLMKGFHLLVMILCTRQIQDTQCGFKLFAASTARRLFGNLHLYRWAFDIEVIYQAEALGVPMKEVAVNWTEVEGSKLITRKLDVVTTSLTMARDMLCVRCAYLFGIWALPSLESSGQKKKEL